MDECLFDQVISNRVYLNVLSTMEPIQFLKQLIEDGHIAIFDTISPVAIILDINAFYRYIEVIDEYNKYESLQLPFEYKKYRLFDENKYFHILKNRMLLNDIKHGLTNISKFINQNKWLTLLKNDVPVAIIISVDEFVKIMEIEKKLKASNDTSIDNSGSLIDDSDIDF
jgi:PHD/YefM family antitoxin component YafN of YafNO toxin-antitoxin module